MPSENPAWQGSWKGRLYRRIREFGCETVREFLAKFPADTYFEAANRLGEDVAPIQVQESQFEEARESDELRQAARDALVRVLRRYVPSGWNGKEDPLVGGTWIGIVISGGGKELEDLLVSVWHLLVNRPIPVGWLPQDEDDPLLSAAFEAGWPSRP